MSSVRLELTICVACPTVAVKLLLPDEVNQSAEAGRFCVERVPSANRSSTCAADRPKSPRV